MLVLSRRIGEVVVIGDSQIMVEIIKINGNQVKIGFTGPKEIPIHRKEIFDVIQNEKDQQTNSNERACPLV